VLRKAGLYLMAAAAVGFAAPTAAAGPAPRVAAPVPLAGTVVLSGSTSGYVPVALTTEMRLQHPFVRANRGSVKMTGGGRMSGFALVDDGLDGNMLIGGRSQFTNKYTDEAGPFMLDVGPGRKSGPDGALVLQPGNYKLYLLTDGKPTTLTLRFKGRGGRTELRPTVATAQVVQGGPASINPGTGLYTAGFDAATGPSVHLSLAAFQTTVHTESVWSKCLFVGKPAGPNPYLPGCPSTRLPPHTGFGLFQPVSDENLGAGHYVFSYYALFYEAGHYGSGGSLTTASVLKESDYSHFFLDLGPSQAAKPR
jgi:hypothetical protein